MRTILGLDPGLARVGYGVIGVDGSRFRHLAHGAIRTKPGSSPGSRLRDIYTQTRRLIREHKPAGAGIETLFFSRATPSALQVAEARGVLLLCLEDNDVPVIEYTPGQVKLAVLGRGAGRAEKRQVQEMIRLLLGLKKPPTPFDAADALAVALCHGNVTWGTVTARKGGRSGVQ